MTTLDKLKAVAATVVTLLVTTDVIGVLQSDAINGAIAAALTVYTAFAVRPHGPKTNPTPTEA